MNDELRQIRRKMRLDRRFDWVGPPDDVSKIRPIRLRRLTDETPAEMKYRKAREELNNWCSQFWAKHNTLFEKKRAEFIAERKRKLGRLEQSNAIDLSDFYRDFLNERRDDLITFNKQWYWRNLRLFWPALQAKFLSLRRTAMKRLRR